MKSIIQQIESAVEAFRSEPLVASTLYSYPWDIRISIPEHVIKYMIDFELPTFGGRKVNYSNLSFRGIQIIPNYEMNITIFHVDWYLLNEPVWVRKFELEVA